MDERNVWHSKIFTVEEIIIGNLVAWLNALENDPGVRMIFAEKVISLVDGRVLVLVCAEPKEA